MKAQDVPTAIDEMTPHIAFAKLYAKQAVEDYPELEPYFRTAFDNLAWAGGLWAMMSSGMPFDAAQMAVAGIFTQELKAKEWTA